MAKAGRPRTKPVNAFIPTLMAEHFAADMAELSENTGIPYMQINRYADIEDEQQHMEALYRAAILSGKSIEEFIEGLLPKLKEEKAALQQKRKEHQAALKRRRLTRVS